MSLISTHQKLWKVLPKLNLITITHYTTWWLKRKFSREIRLSMILLLLISKRKKRDQQLLNSSKSRIKVKESSANYKSDNPRLQRLKEKKIPSESVKPMPQSTCKMQGSERERTRHNRQREFWTWCQLTGRECESG